MADGRREGRSPTQSRTGRTARLGRVAAAGAVRWAGDRMDSRGTADEQRHRRAERVVATVDALVDQLAVMRGAAMKAGQVLSTVEFPGLDEEQSAHLQARLASLRDDVPPVSLDADAQGAGRRVGRATRARARRIEPEPAAAASIGQVYRGRTRDGREVAIKVQYPGIAESVEADMRNLRLLTPLLRQLMPGLEVRPCSPSCASGSSRSATTSSRPATTAGSSASGAVIRSSACPPSTPSSAAGASWSTDWVDGMGFDEVTRQPDAVRDRYAEIVYRFFYGTVRNLDVALGDPHPGNYLL